MPTSRTLTLASWLVGLLGVAAVFFYFRPEQFGITLLEVGVSGCLAWLSLSLLARYLLVEITVMPLAVLGYGLKRMDAFWIGLLRTFSNQVLPLAGVALFAQQVQRRTGSSWSEMASLVTPQFLLAAAALGLVGFSATWFGGDYLGAAAPALLLAFAALSSITMLVAVKAGWFLDTLPAALSDRARRAAVSFRTLAGHSGLLPRLVLLHGATIVMRGSRICVLFFAVGQALDWRQALLIIAITEATALFQLTPGGLGLREGAIVGAGAILGIPTELGAAVALIDRLLEVCTTTLLAAPAVAFLRERRAN